MPTGSRWAPVGLLAAVLAVAAPARADRPPIELAGHYGYRVGGEFDAEDEARTNQRSVDLEGDSSLGLGLAVYRDPNAFYELLYSRQTTRLDDSEPALRSVDIKTEYFQLGGTLIFAEQETLRPYLSMTVGVARFEADGYGSEVKLSGSLGLGLRMRLGARLAVIAGVRGYGTLVESDNEFFCSSVNGEATCLVRGSGDVLLQGEATIGVSLRF